MIVSKKAEFETVSIALIAAFVGTFFLWRNNQNFWQNFRGPVTDLPLSNNLVVPTINPFLKTETSSQISPEGSKKLTEKKKGNPDGTVSYTFTVSDGNGTNPHTLYSIIVPKSVEISIPFNTWSSDNSYLFLQKNGNDALVFKASGAPMPDGQAYYDVLDSFSKKGIRATVKEATGWASPTLLIVNTLNADGSRGLSYWFEVPSKAVIPLSSQF